MQSLNKISLIEVNQNRAQVLVYTDKRAYVNKRYTMATLTGGKSFYGLSVAKRILKLHKFGKCPFKYTYWNNYD